VTPNALMLMEVRIGVPVDYTDPPPEQLADIRAFLDHVESIVHERGGIFAVDQLSWQVEEQ
jgi:hypothetical protein